MYIFIIHLHKIKVYYIIAVLLLKCRQHFNDVSTYLGSLIHNNAPYIIRWLNDLGKNLQGNLLP